MGCKYYRTNIGFGESGILKKLKEKRMPFLCPYHKSQSRYEFCSLAIYQLKPTGCVAKENELIREQMDYHSFNLEALQDKLMKI